MSPACSTVRNTTTTSRLQVADRTRRDSTWLHDSTVVTYVLRAPTQTRRLPVCVGGMGCQTGVPKEFTRMGCKSGVPREFTRMGCKSGDNIVLNGAERQSDTIFVEREKWHTRWRDRETVRTDTIQVESIKIETKEVRYVPRFYKYCAALTVLLLLFLLIRFALWLYKRFY